MKSTLKEATIVLDLEFHRPGKSRKGNMALVDVEADKNSCRLMTDILVSDYYDETVRLEAKVKKFILKYALESPFRNGVFLIPLRAKDEIYAELEKTKTKFDAAADGVQGEWIEIVEDAKKRLRNQFQQKHFPSAGVVRSKFSMSWRLLTFDTPSSMSLGDALYEKEMEKAKAVWDDAEKQVTLALRTGLNEMVNHLIRMLSPKSDGTKNKLHDSAIQNVSDFLDMFDKRNVLNDVELKEVVDKARTVMKGQNKDVLDSQFARDGLGNKLKTVGKELEGLVVEQKRVLSFDD